MPPHFQIASGASVHIAMIIIIYNKLIKFTGIFYKLRTKLSITWLKAVYFAFVHPQILYGIELYANTCPTYLQKLVKLTNKIFRILLNQPLRTRVVELHNDLNVLPVKMLHTQQLLVLVFKCLYHRNSVTVMFRNYFVYNKSIHSHNTRMSNQLHILAPVGQ